MASVEGFAAPRPPAEARRPRSRNQIIVEAAGNPATAAPALAELAKRGQGDPIVAHAAARAKFDAVPYEKGNVPDAAVDEYADADEALIRSHVSDPAGIAYKLSLALELTGSTRPVYPMTAADFRDVLNTTSQTDEQYVASAALDCLTLAARHDYQARDEWDAAVAAYHAALQTHRETEADFDRRYAEAIALSPTPDILKASNGEYLTESMIEEDRRLSFARKVEMINVFREWRPSRDAAVKALGCDGDPCEATFNTVFEAFEAIMAMTPPDLSGLLLQLRLLIERLHLEYTHEAAVDVPTAQRLLDEPLNDAGGLFAIYRNALGLAGIDDPVRHVRPFDAAAWVAAFEALPGHEVTGRGPAFIEDKGAFPNNDIHQTPPGLVMWKALNPWQKDKIKAFAKERAYSARPVLCSSQNDKAHAHAAE